jgi:hypothetical protein
MKTRCIKIISLLLALLMLVSFLTGCSDTGRDILSSFLQEWVQTNFGIDIADNSTTGKFLNGLKLIKLFTQDSTGNPDSDAALGTVKMLKNFKDAEDLMDLGRKSDNATAMDTAINMRPKDWSYRASAATLALKQNNLDKARDEWKKGEDLAYADNNPTAYKRFYTQSINELEAWKESGKLKQANVDQQSFAYGYLTTNYARRYKITNDPKDKEKALYYNELWNITTGLDKNNPPDLGLD